MYPPELRLRFPFHRELAAIGTAQLLVADYYGAGEVSIGVMLRGLPAGQGLRVIRGYPADLVDVRYDGIQSPVD